MKLACAHFFVFFINIVAKIVRRLSKQKIEADK